MGRATGSACETCGRNMRKTRHGLPNHNTECGRCRQNTLARLKRADAAAERRRSGGLPTRNVTLAGRLFDEAVELAETFGHDIGRKCRDYGAAYFAFCNKCHRAVCVDLDESAHPYGSAYTLPCQSMYRPALRKNPFELDWGVAGPQHEPADSDPGVNHEAIRIQVGDIV